MVFQLSRTFTSPGSSQSGMAPIGAGAQQSGPAKPLSMASIWAALRPTKGRRTFTDPTSPENAQRGFPSPYGAGQSRPLGDMPNNPPAWGGVYQHEMPYYDRGAAAFVPNFGKVLYNPIGAGIVALQRPQASYGPAASYEDGSLWWTSQAIPTSIGLQGLTDPDTLAALLSETQIQAVVRTTG